MEQGSQGPHQPLDPGEMVRMLAESIVEDPRVPVNEVWFETEEGRTVLRLDEEPEPAVTIARADLAWLLSCAIDHADHPQYKRPYAALQEAIGEVPPGAQTEPVVDRDGIRVYATDAGRYVAADRAGWVEGTYGTPEEAWTAGAPGE